MSVLRIALCGGATLALGLAFVDAQQPAVNPVQVEAQRVKAQPLQRTGGDLLPAAGLEKLDLNKDQKDKYAKLNEAYQDKQREAKAKVDEALQAKDRTKLKEAVDNQRTTLEKARADALDKLKGSLTDAQKKTLEQVQQQPVQPGVRPPIQIRPIGGIQVPGPIVPPAAQQRLKLTDEQKKQIDDLQKELEGKLQKILNDEQKKILDDMKKATPIRPRPIQPGQIELKIKIKRD
jgi:hypothetical protein